jgi:hypothetical protein
MTNLMQQSAREEFKQCITIATGLAGGGLQIRLAKMRREARPGFAGLLMARTRLVFFFPFPDTEEELKRYEGVLCRPAGSGRRHRYHRVPCQIQLIVPRDKRACGCSRSRVLASHNPSVLLCFCNFLFLRPILPLVAPRGFVVYSTVPVFAPKAVWVRQHMMPRFEFRLFLFKTNCRRV